MYNLPPCNESARQSLASSLYEVNSGIVNRKSAEYVVKTFPTILLDIARLLIEQATEVARSNTDNATKVKNQLKPYQMFHLLLGKAPQVTGLMYHYFESSSFQPLPENLFDVVEGETVYKFEGFSDDLVKEILIAYFKYLSFNPEWFTAKWNWSELGRFMAKHPNPDIRYISASCLAIITKPSRFQHMSIVRDINENYAKFIECQVRNRELFENTFKPLIETKFERATEYIKHLGSSSAGYDYCQESLAKVANVLLLKRDIDVSKTPIAHVNEKIQKIMNKFIPVSTLQETISKIAYALSINQPCLIRGPSGSGKTAILDYIAAATNRVSPPDYIKVQIGDQIDSKLLIGTYVCTEIPGQFEWQPGPLTRAMSYGSWIVFEDIDLAPSDMAQVIHSVIENGNLSCVSCCPLKLANPHPEFRILFTQRTRKSNSEINRKLGIGFIDRLCDIVEMPELNESDMQEVIDTRYDFKQLTPVVLQLFNTSLRYFEDNGTNSSRTITMRDLFKFCDRIQSKQITANLEKYTSSDLDSIFFDAVECFLVSLCRDHVLNAAILLGEVLNKSSTDVERDILTRTPEIRAESQMFSVGRVELEALDSSSAVLTRSRVGYTRQALQLMERISVCIKNREAVLLVGETGVGKTTIVQHIASQVRTQLTVLNLSQQSDSADLLGGYKPVDIREILTPIHKTFVSLFEKTFDLNANENFLHHADVCFDKSKRETKERSTYMGLVVELCHRALEQSLSDTLTAKWRELQDRTRRLSKRLREEKALTMALSFSEGSLLRAVREGHWILLDEINLAEPEVLQCLLLILDSLRESKVYLNASDNDEEAIRIHENFRIFACMNPSTDVGKKDLPIGIRGRFSEFFVDDIEDAHDLRLIVESYVKTCLSPKQIEKVVQFYREVRARAVILADISGNPPVYSLRTLCRALSICSSNICHNMEKSLLESLKCTFFEQLNDSSVHQVRKLIQDILFKDIGISGLESLTIPKPKDNHQYEEVEGFWIQKGSFESSSRHTYVVTPSVKKNLQSICRVLSLGQRKLPILIQGNTSVGKTSLITHLARKTGNKCYRINNHEHTDLQEYVGKYVLKENGELVFQDGLLVRAMKKGYWIILDELNLAASDLLEALNRVLDDNRELFIPEIRQTVKAHSKFALFATQNPPEEYSGRKMLSRAFRNRFVELNFDEIPHSELETILQGRCQMAPQYAKKIVTVMRELQMFRRESGCFNGKSSFMTLRDLFRWGQRYANFKNSVPDDEFHDWDDMIATEGLILLEGRVRTLNEADTVKEIIEKIFKRNLDRNLIYSNQGTLSINSLPTSFKHIHFTPEFKRMFVQIMAALKHNEPVLLCGQTGCGKTTACQLYAASKKRELLTYNCHLNTESSDFVGDVRPARGVDDGPQRFVWTDGPLVLAMKTGSVFLMDEISLADDAVLERVNSVLEPERSITLIEKDGEEIFGHSDFQFVATMNPGGDYGKKELSTALRNRFTEIYCHNTTDISQVLNIVEKCLSTNLLKPKIAPKVIRVMKDFLTKYYKDRDLISIRDVISWTQFLNSTTNVLDHVQLSLQDALLNGASLVFFDQFGTCGHKLAITEGKEFKKELENSLKRSVSKVIGDEPLQLEKGPMLVEKRLVKFGKFPLEIGPLEIDQSTDEQFIDKAPTVSMNVMKLVRAMQLDRPILLEGDPGAGKTSLVSALARWTGHELTRINLSEQTDISDLFGSDLPDASQNDDEPRFCWHDGPMLQAIKSSSWILLDEMNLASQSVLEGLNACFDHRGEIFIPELNRKFKVRRSTTRIFACQNPYSQGAARKGLPQSFLNRFTSIYIDSHSNEDLFIILRNLYPDLPKPLILKMLIFNGEVSEKFKEMNYEFNLRDLIYWCDLTTRYVHGPEYKRLGLYKPERYAQFVYLDRLRSTADKSAVLTLFEKNFSLPIYEPPYRDIRMGENSFIMARSILFRKTRLPPHLPDMCILKYQMPYIESIAKAIEYNKMPIVIGEKGVGKRSMIKIVAGLTGNNLNVIGANREMDTIELLGSYEQKSLQREISDLIDESKKCVLSMINSIHNKRDEKTWTQLFKHAWSALYSPSVRETIRSQSEIMSAYRFQLIELKELLQKIWPLCTSKEEEKYKHLRCKIDRLMKNFLFNCESMYSTGNFEWIDSTLVKSIKDGSWLLIENANLMNPATLDRLNSLVEPDGSLSLNEKGSGTNGIEYLKPHPDFRLILTMDPDNGELSRAMRNRGVEIFVQTRFYFEDYLMLLNQNGFEPEEQKACMTYCIMQTSYDVHERITGQDPMSDLDGSPLAYFGLNYLSTLTHEVRRGCDVDKVLSGLLVAFYHQKGYLEVAVDDTITIFVALKMAEYRKKYEVKLVDERYKWFNLRHDLSALTGGDALTAMVNRDHKLFFEDISEGSFNDLIRLDEIENFDIVNTCTTMKIFLELSTYDDLEYRKCFIHESFEKIDSNLLTKVSSNVFLLDNDYVPVVKVLMPRTTLQVGEMPIDTRNTPDLHEYLQSVDYVGTLKRETQQNRWLLGLHRIMLQTIIELVEERSAEVPQTISLWSISESFKAGKILRENLIRPQVEVASDLLDLLDGIMRVVCNRCFSNKLVPSMMAKFFWISYFICKLRQAHVKCELIAICNQLPMLWALTYQKVLIPIIQECELADLNYKNKKFSTRIQHICDFLDMTLAKPLKEEKKQYKKVLNRHAATSKLCEVLHREVDRFFGTVLERYNGRPSRLNEAGRPYESSDTQSTSGFIWSNSDYISKLFEVQDRLLIVDTSERKPEFEHALVQIHEDATNKFWEVQSRYTHEEMNNKKACTNQNRRRTGLDQFSPIWQLRFIQTRQSKFRLDIADPRSYQTLLAGKNGLLNCVNGIILSPRYYARVIKCLRVLQDRLDNPQETDDDTDKVLQEDADMFAAYLVDHILENIILDNQVVGWTKLRIVTTNLSTSAPLMPEYSPIISLVGSYCLDISHLKLNSYTNSRPQLDSLIAYLWRDYAHIKLNLEPDVYDMELAKSLIHYRSNTSLEGSPCKAHENCQCVQTFVSKRLSTYKQMTQDLKSGLDYAEDYETISKAVDLIYFGFFNTLDFAPIFTLDPSLRSREKLEVYKSELAHIRLDLHMRNTLFYWKTGENLRLNEIDADYSLYPFSTIVLIERRIKLEKSINKLRLEYTNRPKTDDGSVYYELRKEIEMNISRYTEHINSLVSELLAYVNSKEGARKARFNNLNMKCCMLIKNIEKTIIRFRSHYALYSDLTTNFLVGLCFLLQGVRKLNFRVEQKKQIQELGFDCSPNKFTKDIMQLFSINNFMDGNLQSVQRKLNIFPLIDKLVPQKTDEQKTDKLMRLSSIQSLQSMLLRSTLLQLNHHITITPSDIQKCIPIVRNIADLFHEAWLRRKIYIEEQRKQQEEQYHYKPTRTTIGQEISYEQQEFIDICAKFPTYDHIYHAEGHITTPLVSSDVDNLKTEDTIIKLTRGVDISMCIDICKAHYKFMKQASSNLLGQNDRNELNANLPTIEFDQLIKLESETLYSIMRHCILKFDRSLDASSLECHLLQANKLKQILLINRSNENQIGSLKSSIEILDEDIFDIYHHGNSYEALKLQDFISVLNNRVVHLRELGDAINEKHVTLNAITRLNDRISSFLITDPMMKFITGAHTLLEKIQEWNRQQIPRIQKMIDEEDSLIELIKSWRMVEVNSWRSSLHRVKRKYIDDALCDLWFTLYEAFKDPIECARIFLQSKFPDAEIAFGPENERLLYEGFSWYIKEFIEDARLGDYQIRLDLIFSFAIQSRFASLYEQNKSRKVPKSSNDDQSDLKIDFERLTTYVHNVYQQYKRLLERVNLLVESEEKHLLKQLNDETRIVAWQGQRLWDMKQNFRISHRKINKVMNKYLEVLRKTIPDYTTEKYSNAPSEPKEELMEVDKIPISEKISLDLSRTASQIKKVQVPKVKLPIDSLSKAPSFVHKLKQISDKLYTALERNYIEKLTLIEQTCDDNAGAIANFNSHEVQKVVIGATDNKDLVAQKKKLCRQMYHSKKFAMQSVFKSLQNLGVSYQRGLNSIDLIDPHILATESIRGLLQTQSHLVLK